MFCCHWRNLCHCPCYQSSAITPFSSNSAMVSPCNTLAINSFSPFPVLLVVWVNSASSSAHISVHALAHPPSSGQHWWQTPCQPPSSGTDASLTFLMLICSRASTSHHAACNSCAPWMWEGSAGVRPSFIPHRGTWHISSSCTSSCQLPRQQSTPPWSEQTNATNQKHTKPAICTTYLLLNTNSPKHFQQLFQKNYRKKIKK